MTMQPSAVSPVRQEKQPSVAGRLFAYPPGESGPATSGVTEYRPSPYPGLRREEVAMLADVGVTWYTWLEQGREMKPSAAVLSAISKALQCTPAETRHLFILAGLPVPDGPLAAECRQAGPASQRLLQSLMPNPASLQRPNFDILGCNAAFCRLMGVDLDTVPVGSVTAFIST